MITGESTWTIALISGAVGVTGVTARGLSNRVTIGGSLSGSSGSLVCGAIVGAATWLIVWLNGYFVYWTDEYVLVWTKSAINWVIQWLVESNFISATPIETIELYDVVTHAIAWAIVWGIFGIFIGALVAMDDVDGVPLFILPPIFSIVGAVLGAIGYVTGWWGSAVVGLIAGVAGWALAINFEVILTFRAQFTNLEEYTEQLQIEHRIRMIAEIAIGGLLFGILGWMFGR